MINIIKVGIKYNGTSKKTTKLTLATIAAHEEGSDWVMWRFAGVCVNVGINFTVGVVLINVGVDVCAPNNYVIIKCN